MIHTDNRPTEEVLMESLADVEGAERVVIVMEKGESINVRTNCTYKELHWVLSQAKHAALNELFCVNTKLEDDD